MGYYPTQDDDDWHNARRQRLTSTELAKLHLTNSELTWTTLKLEKDTGESQFKGNKYTEWGKEREPKLAPLFKEIDSHLVYNPNPQTIAINDNDDRLCGTPDMLPGDGDCIGEIKTSTKMFRGGRYHPWAPDQYYLQCQLNMWHTGTEACILLVEYCTEEHGIFTSHSYDHQTLRFDPAIIEELMPTAKIWFDWLDGIKPEFISDISEEDLATMQELVTEYAEKTEQAKELTEQAKQLNKRITALADGSFSRDLGNYDVSITNTKDTKRFDSASFKQAHPDLYEQYTKPAAGYTRLTVTKKDK